MLRWWSYQAWYFGIVWWRNHLFLGGFARAWTLLHGEVHAAPCPFWRYSQVPASLLLDDRLRGYNKNLNQSDCFRSLLAIDYLIEPTGRVVHVNCKLNEGQNNVQKRNSSVVTEVRYWTLRLRIKEPLVIVVA